MGGLRELVTSVMPRPRQRRRGAIGIDFSLSFLHMVQLARNPDRSTEVVGSISVAHRSDREELLASPQEIRRQVARGLREGRFKGRRAVLAMPASQFRTMSVNYRTTSAVSDDQAIAALMRERLDGALGDYVIDYVPVRAQARDAEKLAIVAFSPRDAVMRFLDAMTAAGLRIEALEIGPTALCRLAGAVPESESGMTLIINTGHTRSYLTLMSGRRLLMDQGIDFCEKSLLEILARSLEMSEADAKSLIMRTGLHPQCGRRMSGHAPGETGVFNTLLEIIKPQILRLMEDIDRVFMYAAAQARGGGETRICLLGGLARWPGFEQVVSDFTHLPLSTIANPLQALCQASADGMVSPAMAEPEFAVATGLALRGLTDVD